MATGVAAVSGRFLRKVAMVTGSTNGIGYAIAKRLGEEGAHVVISSRNQDNVDQAVEKLKASNISVSGMPCHVGKAEDRTKLIETVAKEKGGIDILVASAGVNPFIGKILDCGEDAWDKIFNVNVKASFFLVKETIPHMAPRGGGSVILMSSITGYGQWPFQCFSVGPYAVSKTALIGLTRALTPQLTEMNIRVNCLAPGYIKTNFTTGPAPRFYPEGATDHPCDYILMKRGGEPEEVAGVAAFLASDDASYITGETIVISGGTTSRL